MTTVRDLINKLERDFDPGDVLAVHIWQMGDVLGYAEHEKEVSITEKEAEKVLEYIDGHVDCELGITWETINSTIDKIVVEREEQ